MKGIVNLMPVIINLQRENSNLNSVITNLINEIPHLKVAISQQSGHVTNFFVFQPKVYRNIAARTLKKQDETNQDDPVIQQLEVELGPPGEATTQVKRLRGARAYMHQYTTEPPTTETKWVSEGSKQPYYTFSGLNSMAKYWFRVVAISQDGQTVYSPVVTRVIQ